MRQQLKIGEVGAQLFHKAHPFLIKTDGRKGDFINPSTGLLIELKSDSYFNSKNFFMEFKSNLETGKAGGPWQAKEHGCDYFVYMFVPERTVYWFKVDELISWLEGHAKDYAVRLVQNKGWAASGYLVPRLSIESLIIKREILEVS